MLISLIVTSLISYLLGSLPPGYLIARMRGVDILSLGSGKMGGTNVLRVLGIQYAILASFLDVMKGFTAIIICTTIASYYSPQYVILIQTISSIFVLTGNNWSIFIWFLTKKLRGGTGIGVVCGTLLFLSPITVLLGFITLITVSRLTRIASLGGLGAITIGLISLFWQIATHKLDSEYWYYTLIMFFFLVIRHKNNIKRLITNTEYKLN